MPHRTSSREDLPAGRDDRVAADDAARRARVRRAAGPRYGRGTGYRPVPATETPSASPSRNKIHSVLSALPIIMLVAGLYFYYSDENAQSHGAPILAESVEVGGTFAGLSVVRSGGDGRHYLWWHDADGQVHGVRILPTQRDALAALVSGDELRMQLAPTVSGSSTLWAWRVERGDVVLVDDSARLR